MKNAITRTLFVMLGVIMALSGTAQGQEISGFSTVDGIDKCTGLGCTRPSLPRTYYAEMSATIETEEDYTASLYYDVSSVSAAYFSGSATPLISGSITGNPTANATYGIPSAGLPGTVTTSFTLAALPPTTGSRTFIDSLTPGIYTEVTDHVVDFFYVTSVGEYYDPYGFSLVNGDGGYDSGYWFSVTVYGTYIEEASVIVGETYDSDDDNGNSALQGPSITTASYQAFIPTDWVPGPGSPTCLNDIYAGDNRSFNSAITSYRAMQAIQMGIGGLTSVNSTNAPPAEATGYSYEFSQNVLVGNEIPIQTYNFNYLNECSPLGINDFGHAPTSDMLPPKAVYSGSNSTSTEFCCSASNPVPLISFAIDWDVPLTLTETSASDLHVTGTLNADCFPAHEVSVAGTDVATFMPTAYTLSHITGCLGGANQIHQAISSDITLTAP